MFLLQLYNFTQATPQTDDTPQVVLLSITTDDGDVIDVAYYTHMANYMWEGLNRTDATLHNVPLYTPNNHRHTYHSVCISNTTSTVQLVWSQNTIITGLWILSHVTVRLPSTLQNCSETFDREDKRYVKCHRFLPMLAILIDGPTITTLLVIITTVMLMMVVLYSIHSHQLVLHLTYHCLIYPALLH